MSNNAKQGLVVLLASQKGGAGKTSSVINLSATMALLDKKKQVILDLDAQGSAVAWSNEFRGEKLADIADFFPAVTSMADGYTTEEFIEMLRANFDVTFLDTAGYIGDDAGSAKRILEECIPLADIIVVPSRGSRTDIHSAIETIDFIDRIIEDVIEPRKVTKVLFGNDLRGGVRSYELMKNTLQEHYNFDSKENWNLLNQHIPSSNPLVSNISQGGNLFVPSRVKPVIPAYLDLCREIFKLHGEAHSSESSDEILVRVKNELQNMRKAAKAAAKAAAKEAAKEAAKAD